MPISIPTDPNAYMALMILAVCSLSVVVILDAVRSGIRSMTTRRRERKAFIKK